MEGFVIEGAPMSKPGGKVSIVKLPLNKIKLNKNSRLNIDPEELDGLMKSIKEEGLLQPIGVVDNENGTFEVCYGNRRFLAVSKLGLHSIPAIVHKKKNESDVDIKNLTENIQRRNISLAEIGRYVKLLEGQGLSSREAAVRLGVSHEYVKSCIDAFNEVPEEFQSDLEIRVGKHQGSGKTRIAPGKISLKVARQIINAEKRGLVTKLTAKKLFKAAKSDNRFRADSVGRYVHAIATGKEDFLSAVEPLKIVTVRVAMAETEYDKVVDKMVTNGPYTSVSQYFIDLLTGVRSGRISVVREKDFKGNAD